MNAIKLIPCIIIFLGHYTFAQLSDTNAIIKNVKLGGLFQIFGTQTLSYPAKGTFLLRRMELKVSGKIIKNIEFVAMIDPVSKAISVNEAGSKIQIINITQDLFLAFPFAAYAKLKVGQFKYPLTREGLEPTEYLHFAERSTIGSIIGDKRDIGLELSGVLPYLQYSIAILNGNGPNVLDNNSSKDIAARVVLKPVEGFKFGGSGYVGNATVNGINEVKKRYCGEFDYSSDNWGSYGEYALSINGSIKSKGFYGAFYYCTKKDLEVSLRFDNWQSNIGNVSGEIKTYCIGGAYYLFNKHMKILINYNLSSNKWTDSLSEIITGVQVIF